MNERRLAYAAVAAAAAVLLLLRCGGTEDRPRPALLYRVLTPEGRTLRKPFFARESVTAVGRDRSTGACRRLWTSQGIEEDRLRIEPPRAGEDLELWVAGCLPLPLPVPPTAEEFRLEYGPRVRIRVLSDDALPQPPFEIHLTARWRGAGDRPDALLRHEFPAAAAEDWFPGPREEGQRDPLVATAGAPEVLARFSSYGPHRLLWSMWRVERRTLRGGHATLASGVGGNEGVVLDVRDEPGEQVFDLFIPSVRLADEVRSLGK